MQIFRGCSLWKCMFEHAKMFDTAFMKPSFVITLEIIACSDPSSYFQLIFIQKILNSLINYPTNPVLFTLLFISYLFKI